MIAFDQRLQSAVDELDSLRTREDAWQVPRIEGELLCHLALATGARLIIEIGTSYGFSGLFWAAALRHTGGKLHTIDISEKKFNSSRKTFEQAGVGDLVINHLGDARQIVPKIAGPIDIAFIDADKPSVPEYFELLWPMIRPRGSVLTDNTITHRQELAAFVSSTRASTDACSLEIPVGNGLEWTVKIS
jgi:predicted O-methyltransferase YrrM